MGVKNLTLASLIAITCVSCGGSKPSTAGSIRRSVASLQHALRVHDARTVCELIVPYPQDLSRAGINAELETLDTRRGQTQFRKYVSSCAKSFHQRDFVTWERLVGTLSVLSVKAHGDIAIVRVTSVHGITGTLGFVMTAGEWRIPFGTN